MTAACLEGFLTMLTITDQQVARLLDYRGVAAILETAFIDLARGEAAMHPRQRSECGGARLSTMGAIWGARGVAGVKVYPTVAGQFGFAVLLFDLETNVPLALLDGQELTRLRTAAMSLLVASRVLGPALGRPARKLALFGAGLQGRSQALALLEQFRFAEIHVVDPAADPAWCEQLGHASGARVTIATPEQAVREADIVVTATRSPTPVFDGQWLAPGAFVCAMGTSTPKVRELDDRTMQRAGRVIVEWLPQSLVEAGEVVLWKEGRDIDRVVDLPRLFLGDAPWRAEPPAITVFKSVGVGLSDVATALLAVTRAREAASGIGR